MYFLKFISTDQFYYCLVLPWYLGTLGMHKVLEAV